MFLKLIVSELVVSENDKIWIVRVDPVCVTACLVCLGVDVCFGECLPDCLSVWDSRDLVVVGTFSEVSNLFHTKVEVLCFFWTSVELKCLLENPSVDERTFFRPHALTSHHFSSERSPQIFSSLSLFLSPRFTPFSFPLCASLFRHYLLCAFVCNVFASITTYSDSSLEYFSLLLSSLSPLMYHLCNVM